MTSNSDNIYTSTYFLINDSISIIDKNELFLVRNVSLFRSMELYIFLSLFKDLSSATQSGLFVNYIKERGFDWQLKFIFSKARDTFLNKSNYIENSFDYIALYDVMNYAVVSCVDSVRQELAAQQYNSSYVYSDYRFCNELGSKHSFSYTSEYSLYDELETNTLWRKYNNSIITTLCSINEELMSSYNIQLDIRYLTRIAKQTIRDIIALDNFYKAANPKLVFMGSDSHKLARITSLLGKTRNYKTFVIQHGAPILPHAYIPLFADWIAVWSDGIKEWFLNHGVPPDKLIVTGNPRYDKLVFSANKSSNKRKIVLITNPVGAEVNTTILNLLLPALNLFKLDFVIKPHPSEPSINYNNQLKKLDNINYIIEKDKTMGQLINKDDLVITANSTAGVEALMLGGILHIVNIRSLPNTIPYTRFDVANDIFTADDAITRIGASINGLNGYPEKAAVFLKWYVGDLDGNSTKRICSFIENIK